ncbi:HNH endonuclease [Halodesulfurarchaeum sp. HSR-GB]|uniref:HNH endonuclease n=1 Tax=Halodesulfurarchaeum sp. HSR-GB TaxID=3074077 RepID=UPI0037C06D54
MAKVDRLGPSIPWPIMAIWWLFYGILVLPVQFVRFVASRSRYLPARPWRLVDSIVQFIRHLQAGSKDVQKRRLRFFLASRLYDPMTFMLAIMGRFRASNDLPPDWSARRRKIYRLDNYQCQVCERGGPNEGVSVHADHIIPRQWGGDHNRENLRTLCKDCHAVRHIRTFE